MKYGQTAAQIVAEARTHIEELTVEEVAAELDNPHVVLVDVREPDELAAGAIAGALHIPRGMLEFRADPTSPYHEPVLLPERRVILHCANGGRSALAAAALTRMGYGDVATLAGGINAWIQSGQSIVPSG